MKFSLKHFPKPPTSFLRKVAGDKQKFKEFWRKYKQLPCSCLWKNFFNALSQTQKKVFVSLAVLTVGCLIFLGLNFYFLSTIPEPDFGGTFREGVVGQPRFINPVYLSSRDVDRDIVELLFSGLMKFNAQGKIVNDLAQSYEVKENGKIWEFTLKKDVFWHDKTLLSADDVVFTIKLIQNPEAESPQRIKWLGVRVEKISDTKIRFKLRKGYSGFLETATLKILPKHIFEKISPKNLPWTLTSKKYLVGTGPFQVKDLKQDNGGYLKSLTLERNPDYFGKKPYLSKISFRFFREEKELLKEAARGGIDAFLIANVKHLPLAALSNFNLYQFSLPRYFGVFFNQTKSAILDKKEIRQALSYGADKNEILEKVFSGKGKVVNSPILPDFYGFNPPSVVYNFNQEKAEELLERAGFKHINNSNLRQKIVSQKGRRLQKNLAYGSRGSEVRLLQECLAKDKEIYPETKITGYFGKKTKRAVIRFQEKYQDEILKPFGLKKGTGKVGLKTREKLNQLCFPETKKITPLEISLKTSENPLLVEMAEILKKQWQAIGVKVNISSEPIAVLETDIIKPRNFEALLFGEVLGYLPDPFAFWHSSQKDYPGLNLTKYNNKEVDALLEKARETLSKEKRRKSLEKFQDLLLEDLPAIFLVKPDLVYLASKKIKGITPGRVVAPAKRFAGVEGWYLKTKRAWK